MYISIWNANVKVLSSYRNTAFYLKKTAVLPPMLFIKPLTAQIIIEIAIEFDLLIATAIHTYLLLLEMGAQMQCLYHEGILCLVRGFMTCGHMGVSPSTSVTPLAQCTLRYCRSWTTLLFHCDISVHLGWG